MNIVEVIRLRVKLWFDHKIRYDSRMFYNEIRNRNRLKFITNMTKCITREKPTFEEVEQAYNISNTLYNDMRMKGLLDVYGNAPVIVNGNNIM